MHLSMLPQAVRCGFLGPIDWAILEASDVTSGGGIVLTSSVGAAPTFGRQACRVFIELNRRHPPGSSACMISMSLPIHRIVAK